MEDIIDVNALFGPLPIASTDLSLDDLRELMERHGVGLACVYSTLGVVLDPAVGNAAASAACSEASNLAPVATLNPTMYFGDSDQVTDLKTSGFRFVRFFPEAQEWPVDFAPFSALLAVLNKVGLPIMVDVGKSGQITALLRVASEFTNGVILSGVTIHLAAECMEALHSRANWCVEISGMLASGAIQLLAETAGPERLLFGTGAPSSPVASILDALQRSDLPEAAIKQILSTNARRVLSL